MSWDDNRSANSSEAHHEFILEVTYKGQMQSDSVIVNTYGNEYDRDQMIIKVYNEEEGTFIYVTLVASIHVQSPVCQDWDYIMGQLELK